MQTSCRLALPLLPSSPLPSLLLPSGRQSGAGGGGRTPGRGSGGRRGPDSGLGRLAPAVPIRVSSPTGNESKDEGGGPEPVRAVRKRGWAGQTRGGGEGQKQWAGQDTLGLREGSQSPPRERPRGQVPWPLLRPRPARPLVSAAPTVGRVWRARCPREHPGSLSPLPGSLMLKFGQRRGVVGALTQPQPPGAGAGRQVPMRGGLLRHCPHPPQRSDRHAPGHIALYTPGVFTFLTETHSPSRQKTHAFQWMLKNDQTALSRGETQPWIRSAREWRRSLPARACSAQ